MSAASDTEVRQCVHHAFASQARRTPDSTALVFEGRRLSYGALEERANQLAHYLRRHGVGPEVRVGLCVERSIETIIGMLGILKAGGAYVPLDPAYPAERLTYVLRDAGAPVVVTRSGLTSLLSHADARVLCLDSHADQIGRESREPPPTGASAENLVYVMYTSGSTGKPKGVMVNHRSVVRLFESVREYLDFGESDAWTLFHSCSFGFSVWEIFGALLYGGRLVVVSRDQSLSPRALHDLVSRERVTVLSQTPSAFRLFLEAEGAGRESAESSLRYIVFSGEALEPRLLRSWIARHGDERPRLVNMYALTETSGEVAYRRLRASDLERETRSVIGVPLPHAAIHVLDEERRPVSVGESGEMYIGGDGVARGYHGLPELTAERFLPDPFAGTAGARLYRTGDRARYLASGEVEFLGRLDDQIKILGFRIEPGEIEAALTRHPGVAEAVVMAREDAAGWTTGGLHYPTAPEKRLVAYVVPDGTGPGREAPTTSGMRAFLKARLPDYMIPHAFVVLDTLPLSPNGKLDRSALPAPARTRPELESEYVAPRGEVEERIHAIWRKVLGLDQLGVHDDFLELGGNSLLSVQVATRVFDAFGVDLPFTALFEATTVAELSELITNLLWVSENQRYSHPSTASCGREEGAL